MELQGQEDWMADLTPDVLSTEVVDEAGDIGTDFGFPMSLTGRFILRSIIAQRFLLILINIVVLSLKILVGSFVRPYVERLCQLLQIEGHEERL